jgi:hypothetical protein
MNNSKIGRLTRRLFILFCLIACLALVSSGKHQKAQAFGCTQFCANNYNACMIECNGDPACQDQCRADYYFCMCLCTGAPGTCG